MILNKTNILDNLDNILLKEHIEEITTDITKLYSNFKSLKEDISESYLWD